MSFHEFAASHGLVLRGLEIGKIIRCSTTDNPRSKNGAYLFEGEWGWCMDWTRHESPIIWQDKGVEDTPQFRQRIKDSKAKHSQERTRNAAKAATKAINMLARSSLELSAYMSRKGFPDSTFNMLERDDDYPLLIIPMRIGRNIIGCQTIGHEGKKRFIFGQITKGATFTIGDGEVVLLVEGFASALSLQIALSKIGIKYKIIVCFSAGNVSKLAKSHPNAIIICDHDESLTSQNIAMSSGLRYWIPPLEGEDVNDTHMRIGLFKLSQLLKKEFLLWQKK